MASGSVFVKRAAIAVGVVLVVAGAVLYSNGIETTTQVSTPNVQDAVSVARPAAPEPTPAPTPAPTPIAASPENDALSVGAAGAAGMASTANALPASTSSDPDIAQLRSRALALPVQGVDAARLTDTYTQARAAGAPHEALDIMAARGTPVLAVEDGEVVKMFLSKPGGITLYQFDPEKKYAYYYAHLDRYAEGVREGTKLSKGQIIGYVGSTGNALPESPHLHFAIFTMGPERQWWRGAPLNPFLVWREAKS